MFKRIIFPNLLKRIQEPRRFIQLLAGPRQTGKTTLARQVAEAVSFPVHFATADEPMLRDRSWLVQEWEAARFKVRENRKEKRGLFILESEYLTGWKEIKR